MSTCHIIRPLISITCEARALNHMVQTLIRLIKVTVGSRSIMITDIISKFKPCLKVERINLLQNNRNIYSVYKKVNLH